MCSSKGIGFIFGVAMIYKAGIMSSMWTVDCESIDECIALILVRTQSGAPIAVYDTEEMGILKFPYNANDVDNVLRNMGDRVGSSYRSIKKIQ